MRNQHAVISRAQARSAGVPPTSVDRAVTSRLLIPVHTGVYRSGAVPPSWHQRVFAACLWAGPRAVASHRSAGALWGLDGVKRRVVEISTTRQVTAPGVIVHRSKDWIGADESNLEGIPVTTVHRTLIDLPAVMKEEALEIALDSALSQRLTSVSFMWRRLNRLGGRGRSGSALLRKMLVERTGLTQHAQNGAETKLVRLLQQRGLDGFVKQFTIRSGRESLAASIWRGPRCASAWSSTVGGTTPAPRLGGGMHAARTRSRG